MAIDFIKLDSCSFDPQWGLRAGREAVRVRKALGCDCIDVHHVGATSVPGLPAVPILDLIAEVATAVLTDLHRLRLLVHGFSETPSQYDTPMFRVHDAMLQHCRVEVICYPAGHPAATASISFFALLRQQPALARAYDAAKQDARSRHGAGSEQYRAEKQVWIQRHT